MASPSPPTKPLLPWKTRLALYLLSTLSSACRRSNGTVNRRLFDFFDFKLPPNSKPLNGVSSSDVVVDTTRNLWFRVFVPSSSVADTKLPVVVYFHGGGFSFLSPASRAFDGLCRLFCSSFPAVVVSVNYRLTPEHRCPAQYDDGFDVLKFLDENDAVLPNIADLSKCFLAGDSAGGNIAHHVAVRICQQKLQVVNVIGLISIQPYFGGEERTESEMVIKDDPIVTEESADWHWKVFLPEGSNRDHEVANVSGPNGVNISGLNYPNTLVVTGGFDPLHDWQKRYYNWLKKCGKEACLIEYPTMGHGFYIFPEVPEAGQFISHLKDFITTQLSNIK